MLQFGGLALRVLILFWRTPKGHATPGPNWGLLIGVYALAKVFASAELQIWELTGHLVAGHVLKHLAASVVALAVIAPLYRRATRFG